MDVDIDTDADTDTHAYVYFHVLYLHVLNVHIYIYIYIYIHRYIDTHTYMHTSHSCINPGVRAVNLVEASRFLFSLNRHVRDPSVTVTPLFFRTHCF